jgi:HEAT repeat protein
MPLFGPPGVAKLKAKGDVPGLIKALGRQKNSAVRQAGATALGHLCDARAVEPLIRRLVQETDSLATTFAKEPALVGGLPPPRPALCDTGTGGDDRAGPTGGSELRRSLAERRSLSSTGPQLEASAGRVRPCAESER